METTIMACIGIIGHVLGLYWDHGKENGNCYCIPTQRASSCLVRELCKQLLSLIHVNNAWS